MLRNLKHNSNGLSKDHASSPASLIPLPGIWARDLGPQPEETWCSACHAQRCTSCSSRSDTGESKYSPGCGFTYLNLGTWLGNLRVPTPSPDDGFMTPQRFRGIKRRIKANKKSFLLLMTKLPMYTTIHLPDTGILLLASGGRQAINTSIEDSSVSSLLWSSVGRRI